MLKFNKTSCNGSSWIFVQSLRVPRNLPVSRAVSTRVCSAFRCIWRKKGFTIQAGAGLVEQKNENPYNLLRGIKLTGDHLLYSVYPVKMSRLACEFNELLSTGVRLSCEHFAGLEHFTLTIRYLAMHIHRHLTRTNLVRCWQRCGLPQFRITRWPLRFVALSRALTIGGGWGEFASRRGKGGQWFTWLYIKRRLELARASAHSRVAATLLWRPLRRFQLVEPLLQVLKLRHLITFNTTRNS